MKSHSYTKSRNTTAAKNEAARRTRQAKFTVIALSVIACFIMAAHSFPNSAYTGWKWLPVLLLGMMAPTFIAMYYFKGLITLGDQREKFGKSSAMPLLVISFCLVFCAIDFCANHMEIIAWKPLWRIAAPVAILLTLGHLLAVIRYPDPMGLKIFQSVLYGLIFTASSFSIVLYANCALDSSAVETYITTVLNKRIAHGKNRSYHVQVAGWTENIAPQEISVRSDFFNRVGAGDKLTVSKRQGYLDVEWFEVVK